MPSEVRRGCCIPGLLKLGVTGGYEPLGLRGRKWISVLKNQMLFTTKPSLLLLCVPLRWRLLLGVLVHAFTTSAEEAEPVRSLNWRPTWSTELSSRAVVQINPVLRKRGNKDKDIPCQLSWPGVHCVLHLAEARADLSSAYRVLGWQAGLGILTRKCYNHNF